MSSPLSHDEVQRIADLARLELTDDEVALFARQLGDILGYVEQIQALETSGIPPTAHVLVQPLDRADEIVPALSRDEALANAPDAATAAGLFKVPRVLG